ncbi:acyl-CoA carboxylase subunit epsilon [Microbacterium sp. LWH12-1.2]|uniref:acyl-CoA carboxylase subunit epsilon n=1 Tax=Microbacterium sp. LWH12-1.2 TaxID=3135259 RepID=UPI003424F7D0
MTAQTPPADSSGEQTPSVEIIRGTASEEELAALVAVISDAYAGEAETAVAEEPHVSAWTRTQRSLRTPLRRDIPWGRYSG